MQTVDMVRSQLDQVAGLMQFDDTLYTKFLQNPQSALDMLGIEEEAENNKLYAWIPVPTLLCPTPANPRTSADCPTIIGCPQPPKK